MIYCIFFIFISYHVLCVHAYIGNIPHFLMATRVFIAFTMVQL